MSLATQYDQWHQRVFDSCPEHPDESSPWYTLVLEYLAPVENKRVLEIACGRGGFASKLASRGAIVFGSDFSASALRIARRKALAPGGNPMPVALTQADACRLPYATGSFDIVISCETIEHVPDAQAAVCEMYRVARPGGRLFLTTPNYSNFMGLYELYAKFRHPNRKDDQPFDRRQWFPQVRGYIRRAGWTILRTDGTVHQFPFVPGRNPVTFPSLEKNRMIRRLLSPLAFHYFVIAQKENGA